MRPIWVSMSANPLSNRTHNHNWPCLSEHNCSMTPEQAVTVFCKDFLSIWATWPYRATNARILAGLKNNLRLVKNNLPSFCLENSMQWHYWQNLFNQSVDIKLVSPQAARLSIHFYCFYIASRVTPPRYTWLSTLHCRRKVWKEGRRN